MKRQVTREGQEELGEITRPEIPTAPVGGETATPPSTGTPNPDASAGGTSAPPPRPPATPPPAPIPAPPPPVRFDLAGQGEGASSFARPGSAAARPFRSMNYLTSRLAGGSPGEARRVGFGAGAPVVGGAQGFSSFPGSQDMAGELGGEDELARIMASISGRYR